MERMTKSGAAHDEFPIGTANGFLALVVALLLLVAGGLLVANSISSYGVRWGLFASGIVLLIVAVLTLAGLYTLSAKVHDFLIDV